MSMHERIKKASQYCKNNNGYTMVVSHGEKPLLVRNATGVRAAKVL